MIRYDLEENFLINNDLANEIDQFTYKGIKVQYIYDTNTIIFYRDSKEIDCIVYRNYTKEQLKKYIDNQLLGGK